VRDPPGKAIQVAAEERPQQAGASGLQSTRAQKPLSAPRTERLADGALDARPGL
jgi:hypothetical protein